MAVAWARKDHALADALLAGRRDFGLVEVLKAATLLDAGRQVREAEKRLKRLQMQPKVKARKLAKVKTTINNLQALRPSVSGLHRGTGLTIIHSVCSFVHSVYCLFVYLVTY